MFPDIFRPEVLVFLIPLSAIIGGFYLTSLKIKAKQNPGLSSEDKKMLAGMIRDNADMKDRLENLEAIITSIDQDLLTLKASENEDNNQERVKQLSDKLKSS